MKISIDDNAFDKLELSELTGKPVMHFVHANGIPASVYTKLIKHWQTYFSVCVIERLGTNHRYPIDNNWRGLTYEVADSIDDACRLHGVKSLVAVGHSVGAMTTLQALEHHPKRIHAAILLDPALYMGRRSLIWYLMKCSTHLPWIDSQIIDKASPAGKSKHRKAYFASVDLAYSSLRHKALFKDFDEVCFDDYLRYGFDNEVDGGITLAIPKMTEVAIFRTMPTNYWYYRPKITCPIHLFAGSHSHFSQVGSYRQAQSKLGIAVTEVVGSHMFPLEHPDDTAMRVLAKIAQLS